MSDFGENSPVKEEGASELPAEEIDLSLGMRTTRQISLQGKPYKLELLQRALRQHVQSLSRKIGLVQQILKEEESRSPEIYKTLIDQLHDRRTAVNQTFHQYKHLNDEQASDEDASLIATLEASAEKLLTDLSIKIEAATSKYSEALINAAATSEHGKSRNRSSKQSSHMSSKRSSKKSNSSVSSMKIKLAMEAAATVIEIKYVDETAKLQAEQAKQQAEQAAKQQAEQAKAQAEQKKLQLKKKAEIEQAQLKALNDLETEELQDVDASSIAISYPEIDPKMKVEAFVKCIQVNQSETVKGKASSISSQPLHPPPFYAKSAICKPTAGSLDTANKQCENDNLHASRQAKVVRESQTENLISIDPTPKMNTNSSRIDGNDSFVEIAQEMCNQLTLSRLPIAEPQVFTGSNPLDFPNWKIDFDTLIHHKSITPSERLHFLRRYLGGEAKEAVEGFFMLPSQSAYEQSYRLLIKRYGDHFKLASSFRQRLKLWPKIGSSDGLALRKFVDFLRQCEMAMHSLKTLSILNDESENADILRKLPAWLVRRWTRKVATYRAGTDEFPSFSEFVEFLTIEEDITNDPLISFMREGSNNEVNKLIAKRNSLATEVSEPSSLNNGSIDCLFCKNKHSLHVCSNFRTITYAERQNFIKINRLCFGCLYGGHIAKDCQNRKTCDTCRGRHPTVMHRDDTPANTSNTADSSESLLSAATHANHNVNSSKSVPRKSSMIVPVYISHNSKPREEQLVYAMLDTQSDSSFISGKTLRDMGINGIQTQLVLSTMTSQDRSVTCEKCSGFRIRGYNSHDTIALPSVYSRESIPANRSHIPTEDMINSWPHLESLRGQIMPKTTSDIGLLIGYDCPRALEPKQVLHSPSNKSGPFALRTELGWGIVGVVGSLTDHYTDEVGLSHRILVSSESSQISLPMKVKEIISPSDCLRLLASDFSDQAQNEESVSIEEKQFLEIMRAGIKTDSSGNYSLPLPFKDNKKDIFNNKNLVLGRMRLLRNKLNKDADYKREYCNFMEEMFSKGFAEKVQSSRHLDTDDVWYIPHFGTYHKVKKKLRIVFDCSARYHGLSLNDTLLKGPDLVNALIGVLCRFRKGPIAFGCDIEKMFYALHVHESDREYLRFLWWDGGDTTKPLSTYRMTAHIFGAISSPACATYGLRAIADEFCEKYGMDVHEFIYTDFYVDDGLKSVNTIDYASDLIKRTVSLCQEKGVRLHKFVSNSPELMKTIPTSEWAADATSLSLNLDDHPPERVLGITWDIISDTFNFKVELKERPWTRRGILSAASSIFDPLGLIAPFTVRAKLILQQLCRWKLDWDEEVSPGVANAWKNWCSEVPTLHDLKVSRCFQTLHQQEIKDIQLHHFSDASSCAYGACSYLRLVDSEGKISVSLVMAKARVAPLTAVTIPRLELMGAVIASRLATLLDRELKYPQLKHVFWTDSKIVLGYLANEARRFKVYVANRVQEIRSVSDPSQWHHISGDLNPADLASRGISAEMLCKSHKWFHGPEFLHQKSFVIDTSTVEELSPNDPEVKSTVFCSRVKTDTVPFSERFKYFSDWHSLRRSIALIILLASHLRKKAARVETTSTVIKALNVSSLQEGEHVIIRSTQACSFSDEIETLQMKGTISKKSPLHKLDCFLDNQQVLRVGGRLRFANLYDHHKFPILLPRHSHVTNLILRNCHNTVKHQGRGMTINEVRSRGSIFFAVSPFDNYASKRQIKPSGKYLVFIKSIHSETNFIEEESSS